ncbi:hypothetical protein ACSBR1_002309 [Camellia fascicularis]
MVDGIRLGEAAHISSPLEVVFFSVSTSTSYIINSPSEGEVIPSIVCAGELTSDTSTCKSEAMECERLYSSELKN